ncbi:family 20 glycosylhydrolase [Pelomonas sp. UHG3]|uniref:Family 20 glycosylhydrolase n=1 Tax=Roseateles hydrophilus TaxID=2975054 RepID=A0ACC6CD63_9BURK|nr:family 20 glycosylhydrolase [Pelomonas sp. UHG3]MCY4746225.1 family 20 glycosylhydrolase [Pelomonas sp. UHG3]
MPVLSRLAATLLPRPWALQRLPGAGPQVVGLRDVPPAWQALLPWAGDAPAAARLQLPSLPSLPSARPQLGDDESFRLRLTAEAVRVQAATPAGVSHALHALSQLWWQAREAGLAALPALQIDDAPRHPWRGLLVDVARRPLPFDALLGLLDGMAAARFNVLHWHLTDDQAWRLASARYPRLQTHASGGFCYTLDQARRLVDEAGARGIRVVPELDLPGHCWALGLAHPELLCAPAPTAAQPGFGVFGAAVNPESDALYAFLDSLLGEWAEVFPDPFVHLGGDELAPAAWTRLAEQRGTSLAALQAAYLARVAGVLRRHGKRLLAWDEMGQSTALPAGSVLQCWRGDEALRLAPPGLGGRLRSAGFYLDQIHPAAYHWRRPLQAPPRPPAPADDAPAWSLRATVGAWQVEGRLWLQGDDARLHLRSTGTLDEWLAPRVVPEPGAGPTGWRLQVDSDLGELELWGPGAAGCGWLRVNALRQPCDWQPLPAGPAGWPADSGGPAVPMLGGEAALWGELVEAPQLPLRLWPRALAVAERLWSDPAGAGHDLAPRLAAAQCWLVATGRLPADPAAPLFAALCPDTADRERLRALAAWLEPGSGYARQHAKKRALAYHQHEPLDRLADALPAESPLMAALGDDAAAWQAALAHAREQLPAWRVLLAAKPRLAPALPLLDALDDLSALGLALWAGRKPGDAQCRLHRGAALVDEMLPALVQPLQRRLDALA